MHSTTVSAVPVTLPPSPEAASDAPGPSVGASHRARLGSDGGPSPRPSRRTLARVGLGLVLAIGAGLLAAPTVPPVVGSVVLGAALALLIVIPGLQWAAAFLRFECDFDDLRLTEEEVAAELDW